MRVDGTWYRTIWLKKDDECCVQIIDQRHLPHSFVIEDISTLEAMCTAIKDMHLRGAGLIGCAAAYGVYLASIAAAREANSSASSTPSSPSSSAAAESTFRAALNAAGEQLLLTRPTAVNLRVGVERVSGAISRVLEAGGPSAIIAAVEAAKLEAAKFTDEDASWCKALGQHGCSLLEALWERKRGSPSHDGKNCVNVLTHCNAGWLAFADWGSALSPVFAAFDKGIPIHVWVDETRPRIQGALTAWELASHGVPHTVIADNAGGHLMRVGLVDVCITGADRVTSGGDACNKIGTYLKALAAKDNNVPFYVALPSSTIDWKIEDGMKIPIEERGADEVKYVEGLSEEDGKRRKVLVLPAASSAGNWGFDVTPRRLVTGLITERGTSQASVEALTALFPDKVS